MTKRQANILGRICGKAAKQEKYVGPPEVKKIITGADLLERGMKEGPFLGFILKNGRLAGGIYQCLKVCASSMVFYLQYLYF